MRVKCEPIGAVEKFLPSRCQKLAKRAKTAGTRLLWGEIRRNTYLFSEVVRGVFVENCADYSETTDLLGRNSPMKSYEQPVCNGWPVLK